MDVLTDVLNSVRMSNEVYGRLELSAPWGVRVEGCARTAFYAVARGSGWLDVEGVASPIALEGGDFVLFPRARAHTLYDSLGVPVKPLREIVDARSQSHCLPGSTMRYGGGGTVTSIICGYFKFADGDDNPLIASLPPVVHVRADGEHSVQWLETTLQFVATEAASALPGAATVANRLADILFVQALRSHLASRVPDDEAATAADWLRALADPQIGRALQLMHASPADPWTVETLAAKVAMSRSAFAARFKTQVGDAPLNYLTGWRMRVAGRLLRSGQTVAATACAVGYESEASFGKTFKRRFGVAPGTYRRTKRNVDGLTFE